MLAKAQHVAVILVCLAWAGVGVYLYPTLRRIDQTSATLLSCKGNPSCLPSELLAVSGSIRATSGEISKAMPALVTAAKTASGKSVEASANAADAAKEATLLIRKSEGVIDDLDLSAKALHDTLTGMDADIHSLLASSNETVQKAGQTLEGLTVIEGQLQEAIRDGSPRAMQIADSMLATINSPDITSTLKNIDDASKSGASVIETVNIVTLPLRKKVNQVKWLLEKILNLVKVTFSPF